MEKTYQTYVTLKQAEMLKRIGFNGNELVESLNAKAYGKNGDEVNWTTRLFYCWKPSLDNACKWLRENFDMHVNPHATYNKYGVIYVCSVFFIHKDRVHNYMLKEKPLTIDFTPPQIFDTYELAQSAGFDFALKSIFHKKIRIISQAEKERRLKENEKIKKEEKKRLDKSLANTKKLFTDGKTIKIGKTKKARKTKT